VAGQVNRGSRSGSVTAGSASGVASRRRRRHLAVGQPNYTCGTGKVDAPERYTLRFESTGRITMQADWALTRMMCPPGSLSDRFVKEVGRASSSFVKDGDLFLELPVDSGTLRFRRQG
jgi:hypothetical protein